MRGDPARNWSRLVIPSLAVTEVCHLLADPQRRGRVGLAAEFCAATAGELAPIGPDDRVLGSADAPVTVVEYASMTCPHCGKWETQVFPQVEKNWIDTGKIRFVFRDFPLDGSALKASQLAHCTGNGDDFWRFLKVEFGNQLVWAARGSSPAAAWAWTS